MIVVILLSNDNFCFHTILFSISRHDLVSIIIFVVGIIDFIVNLFIVISCVIIIVLDASNNIITRAETIQQIIQILLVKRHNI